MSRLKYLLVCYLLVFSTGLPRFTAGRVIARTPIGRRDNNDIFEETSEVTDNILANKLKSDDPAILALERNLTRMVDRAVEEDLQDWWRSFESLAERKRHVLINVSAKIHLKLSEIKEDKTISSKNLDKFFGKITEEVSEIYNEEARSTEDFHRLSEKLGNGMIQIKNDFSRVAAQSPVVEEMKQVFDLLDDTQVRQMSDAILFSAIDPNSVANAGFWSALGKYIIEVGKKIIYEVVKEFLVSLVKEAIDYFRGKKKALSGLEKQVANDLKALKDRTLNDIIKLYNTRGRELTGIWNKHIQKLIKILTSDDE